MSDTEQRNDGLHPRHPGRGRCAVIELESTSGKVEEGGFLIFLPSGETKQIAWRTVKPITPTLDASKDYVTKVIQSIIDKHGYDADDIAHTNWTSVAAAVQRVIMDFNDKLMKAINGKMAADLILPGSPNFNLH